MTHSLKNIDLIVNEALAQFNVPGVAIGVIIDSKIALTCGYGIRDLVERLPITEKTLFPIASCTKAFTSLMLGQLVEKSQLAWDDAVIKYIPEFRLFDQKDILLVTIRDLLAHRTGIARHDAILFFSELANSKITQSDILEILQYLEPTYQLRERFQYNNIMYAVAAIIMERVTKESWEESIFSRIFMPLEMMSTNVSIERLKWNLDFALPHAEIEGIIRALPFYETSIKPAGGINSNIADMTKWILQFLTEDAVNKHIISKKIIEEMHTIQMPFYLSQNKNEEIHSLGYGLGWFAGMYQGLDVISHGGDIDGFSSEVFILPQKKSGGVILTNSSTDGRYVIYSIKKTIMDKLLGRKNQDWISHEQQKRSSDRLSLKTRQKNASIKNPVRSMYDYEGVYENLAYGTVQIHIKDGQICATYQGIHIDLIYKSNDIFEGQVPRLLHFSVSPLIDFSFSNNLSGDVNELYIAFESFRSAAPIVFRRKFAIA